MADSRKYYYLKLKENYFDDDAVVLLESMPGGEIYSNMLLKLYLKSLKFNGRLMLSEDVPYTAQMLSTVTRQREETVKTALTAFTRMGLMQPLADGTLYMNNIELLIGHSSTCADRKRKAQLALRAGSLLPTVEKTPPGREISPPKCEFSPPKCEFSPPEIEIEKEIKTERERKPPAPALGRFENVLLSDQELRLLKSELPQKWQYYVERLSSHMASTGKQYHSHLATILKWSQEDGAKTALPTYTCQAEESL